MALVVRKKKNFKNNRTNALVSTNSRAKQQSIVAFVPRRNQRSMLHQTDLGRGPELKSHDLSTTFAPPLTATFSSPQCLNLIAQGASQSERIGRRYVVKSVQWRAVFDHADPASQHRVLVVYDKQANGALPSTSDVLAASQNFNSPMNLSNSDRFVILQDEITDSAQSSAMNISAKRYTKCNLEVLCNGATGLISNINSGSIFMMIANNADLTIGQVTAVWVTSRIRYVDG